MAVWSLRSTAMPAAEDHLPVAGLYSSAEAMTQHLGGLLPSNPPVTKTLPSKSKVAECEMRGEAMPPVGENLSTSESLADAVGINATDVITQITSASESSLNFSISYSATD